MKHLKTAHYCTSITHGCTGIKTFTNLCNMTQTH